MLASQRRVRRSDPDKVSGFEGSSAQESPGCSQDVLPGQFTPVAGGAWLEERPYRVTVDQVDVRTSEKRDVRVPCRMTGVRRVDARKDHHRRCRDVLAEDRQCLIVGQPESQLGDSVRRRGRRDVDVDLGMRASLSR